MFRPYAERYNKKRVGLQQAQSCYTVERRLVALGSSQAFRKTNERAVTLGLLHEYLGAKSCTWGPVRSLGVKVLYMLLYWRRKCFPSAPLHFLKLTMVQLESSAPLLTSRVHQGAATSISHNANTYAASLQEAPEPERPSCKDRKPWRRRWSHFAHSFIKLATGIKAGYKRSTHAIRRSWKKSWTVETFSFIFSVLTLAGLVATLSTHQGKPLPKWPQLITINSVLSLFSLIMRTGVTVVLAEGMP